MKISGKYVLIALGLAQAACSGEPGQRDVQRAMEAVFATETSERKVLTELGMHDFLPELESVEKVACQPADDGAVALCEVHLAVRQWGVVEQRRVQVVLARADRGWEVRDTQRTLRAAGLVSNERGYSQ